MFERRHSLLSCCGVVNNGVAARRIKLSDLEIVAIPARLKYSEFGSGGIKEDAGFVSLRRAYAPHIGSPWL